MVNLKTLQLHGNGLGFINLSIFDDLPSLEHLTLHDNPWECTCAFGPAFQKFITNDFISEPRIISCKYFNLSDVFMQSAMTGPFVELKHATQVTLPLWEIDFSHCENSTTRTIHKKSNSVLGVIITVTVFVSIGCLGILIVRNLLLVKVWLYNRFGIHFRHEADDDEDKPYDVFIAHARNDDAFVIGSILPELEERQVSYKVTNMHFIVLQSSLRSK